MNCRSRSPVRRSRSTLRAEAISKRWSLGKVADCSQGLIDGRTNARHRCGGQIRSISDYEPPRRTRHGDPVCLLGTQREILAISDRVIDVIPRQKSPVNLTVPRRQNRLWLPRRPLDMKSPKRSPTPPMPLREDGERLHHVVPMKCLRNFSNYYILSLEDT